MNAALLWSETERPAIGNRITAPVVALLLALLMWIASLFAPPFEVPFPYRVAGTVTLAVIGLSISFAAKLPSGEQEPLSILSSR